MVFGRVHRGDAGCGGWRGVRAVKTTTKSQAGLKNVVNRSDRESTSVTSRIPHARSDDDLAPFIISLLPFETVTMRFSAALALLLIPGDAFSFTVQHNAAQSRSPRKKTCIFMGRAAAVRASTKAKTDGRKAKINAVFGKRIIMAVKEGGSGDPQANRQLNDVIKQAKANKYVHVDRSDSSSNNNHASMITVSNFISPMTSVPIDNINRAIKKATESNTADFKESVFEAYGFGGASMIINVLTDNSNRASSDVRSAVNKRDGKIAESGSVLFMYDKRGMVTVPAALDEDALLEAAIEAGCDDYEMSIDGDATILSTDPKEVSLMMDAVKSMGFEEGVSMKLGHVSKAPVEVSDEEFEKNMQIIDALEDLDDVDSVEHNMSN